MYSSGYTDRIKYRRYRVVKTAFRRGRACKVVFGTIFSLRENPLVLLAVCAAAGRASIRRSRATMHRTSRPNSVVALSPRDALNPPPSRRGKPSSTSGRPPVPSLPAPNNNDNGCTIARTVNA